MIDATGGRIQVLIEGTDYSDALFEDQLLNCSALSVSGLITVTGTLTLCQSTHCPASLDPLANTFWQIGLEVQLFAVRANGVSLLLATLLVRTRPVYDEWQQTLTLDLCDQLTFDNDKTPQDKLTDADLNPTVGLSRSTVIGKLLEKAGSGLGNTGPTALVYYPPQKFGDKGWPSVAAEVAFAAPDDEWFLYTDRTGTNRLFKWSDVISTPYLSISDRSAPNTNRLKGDEYAKPVETVIVNGSAIHTCDTTGDQIVEERTAPLNSLIGGSDTRQVPVYGLYRNTQISGNTVTIVETEKAASVTTTANVQTAVIAPQYSYQTQRISTSVKTYGSGTSTLGDEITFIVHAERVDQRPIQTTTQTSNSVVITEDLEEWQRVIEDWSYDPDYFCTRYLRHTDQTLSSAYPVVVPPIGTPSGLIPPQFQSGTGTEWVPISEVEQTWTKTGCAADDWQLTETTRLASAQIGGQSRYVLVETGTTITQNSAPIDPERLPLGYSSDEQDITGRFTATALGLTTFFDTERTETLPWLDDEASCTRKATWIQDYDYGLAQGRNFQLPLLDRLILGFVNRPIFRFDYTHIDGSINSYCFQGWALKWNAEETIFELDAPLLGEIKTATPTYSGGLLQVALQFQQNQPVVFYPAPGSDPNAIWGTLSAGTVYYANPNGSGGITVSATPGGSPITLTNSNPGTIAPTQPTQPIYNTPISFVATLDVTASFAATGTTGPLSVDFGVLDVTATFEAFGLGGLLLDVTASFAPGTAAQITSYSPAIATTGTTVTLTGVGFTGATAVSFGGTPASSFVVGSDTQITAVVGSGATGNIVITLPTGTLTATGFQWFSAGGGTSSDFNVVDKIVLIQGL